MADAEHYQHRLGPHADDERRAEVAKLKAEGYGATDIARIMGISRQAVYGLLKRSTNGGSE